eukprot:15465469-Alexandrium_andersonii.AAC.1
MVVTKWAGGRAGGASRGDPRGRSPPPGRELSGHRALRSGGPADRRSEPAALIGGEGSRPSK